MAGQSSTDGNAVYFFCLLLIPFISACEELQPAFGEVFTQLENSAGDKPAFDAGLLLLNESSSFLYFNF
jgi:hypothetical protein